MVRKLFCAMFVMVVAVAFVAAEEFNASITKIDGNKVTYQKYKKGMKGKKGEKDGDPVTIEVAKDAKVVQGKFDKDAKKFVDGDAVEGGLKADIFSKASDDTPVAVRFTTDDDKKNVTKIMVVGKKKAAQ